MANTKETQWEGQTFCVCVSEELFNVLLVYLIITHLWEINCWRYEHIYKQSYSDIDEASAWVTISSSLSL